MTERDKLLEQYNSDKTNYSEKPHILRLINKIDTENDRTLEVIRVKLRWLLENGYMKNCETDIESLLEVSG